MPWSEKHRKKKHREYQREYRAKHRDRLLESRRRHSLRKNYDISLEQWEEMFEEQKGCCAICGVHQSEIGSTFHTDHCHETEKVRALLCSMCNKGLGAFRDSVENLRNAVEYLELHK